MLQSNFKGEYFVVKTPRIIIELPKYRTRNTNVKVNKYIDKKRAIRMLKLFVIVTLWGYNYELLYIAHKLNYVPR